MTRRLFVLLVSLGLFGFAKNSESSKRTEQIVWKCTRPSPVSGPVWTKCPIVP
jgi:hypothetical protein